MSVNYTDFDKIWASTSPLTPYEFSESQYKEGWNFVGATPPSRQMWDFLQKNNDEKMQYLAANYLPLSGGTMTGAINGNPVTLTADDGNGNIKSFVANADGTMKWGENNVLTDATVGTLVTKENAEEQTISASTTIVADLVSLSAGVWVITGKVRFPSIPPGRIMIQIRQDGASIDTTYDAIQAFYSPSAVNQQFALSVTRVLNLPTATTIKLMAFSGSTSSISHVYLNAVRIV